MVGENNPLVSINVITYNSSKFVLETLESAKAQTYQNIELIVSDDCSTDNTVEICREWIEKNKDRFVRTELITVEKNTGIAANCNRAVKACRGEWIKGIAGDDALMHNCIDVYIDHIKEFPNKLVLYSNVAHYIGTLKEEQRQEIFKTENLKISQPEIKAKEQFEILLRINKVWAGSLFIARKIFDEIGYYDDSVRLWEDRPMLLKITKNDIKLHFVNFISCKYRLNPNSVQSQKNKQQLITSFQLERDLYYINNYLKYLPWFERLINWILLKRIVFIEQINCNKDTIIVKLFLSLTSFPWSHIRARINRKYL